MRPLPFLIFLGFPLLHLVWWWAAARVLRSYPRWRTPRVLVHLFGSLIFATFIWVLAARFFGIGVSAPVPVLATAYIWFLIILPWAALLAFVAVLLAKWRTRPVVPPTSGATKAVPAAELSPAGAVPPRPSRRQLLAAGLATVPPLVTFGNVGVALPRLASFRIRQIDVPLAGLPPELDGLTIAHVSDLHAGHFVSERLMRRVADETNRLRADLVCFTGDLIDFSLATLPAGLDMLRRIDPRGGLFCCEGNHDLFDDRAEFERRMKAANVGMLLNEAATVHLRGVPVQVLGTKWSGRIRGEAGGGDALSTTLALRDANAFPILLAHHPHEFDRAADAGVPLTLAGHTHGGQLMLTERLGAGPMLFRYWSGLYRRGSAALVVSNGVGNWFPLRINAPAEIVRLTLRREVV